MTKSINDETTERWRKERKEKEERISTMLAEVSSIDVSISSPMAGYEPFQLSNWPEPKDALPNVVYRLLQDNEDYRYFNDPEYMFVDGCYRLINWTPSVEEMKKLEFMKMQENFQKKSKHLYKWRNARHLRRH